MTLVHGGSPFFVPCLLSSQVRVLSEGGSSCCLPLAYLSLGCQQCRARTAEGSALRAVCCEALVTESRGQLEAVAWAIGVVVGETCTVCCSVPPMPPKRSLDELWQHVLGWEVQVLPAAHAPTVTLEAADQGHVWVLPDGMVCICLHPVTGTRLCVCLCVWTQAVLPRCTRRRRSFEEAGLCSLLLCPALSSVQWVQHACLHCGAKCCMPSSMPALCLSTAISAMPLHPGWAL